MRIGDEFKLTELGRVEDTERAPDRKLPNPGILVKLILDENLQIKEVGIWWPGLETRSLTTTIWKAKNFKRWYQFTGRNYRVKNIPRSGICVNGRYFVSHYPGVMEELLE